jgi:hypothetical protein
MVVFNPFIEALLYPSAKNMGRQRAVGKNSESAYLCVMANDLLRATKRPPGVNAPPHWDNPPVPEPKVVIHEGLEEDGRPDPVRYGDWERKGIAIDF